MVRKMYFSHFPCHTSWRGGYAISRRMCICICNHRRKFQRQKPWAPALLREPQPAHGTPSAPPSSPGVPPRFSHYSSPVHLSKTRNPLQHPRQSTQDKSVSNSLIVWKWNGLWITQGICDRKKLKDQTPVFMIAWLCFMSEVTPFETDLKIPGQTVFYKISILSVML